MMPNGFGAVPEWRNERNIPLYSEEPQLVRTTERSVAAGPRPPPFRCKRNGNIPYSIPIPIPRNLVLELTHWWAPAGTANRWPSGPSETTRKILTRPPRHWWPAGTVTLRCHAMRSKTPMIWHGARWAATARREQAARAIPTKPLKRATPAPPAAIPHPRSKSSRPFASGTAWVGLLS